MKESQFTKLLSFLERLDNAKITYWMEHAREDSILISTVAPGEYWEIEFMEDGSIEIERYRSTGKIEDESRLADLFAAFSNDDESSNSEADEANVHDATV